MSNAKFDKILKINKINISMNEKQKLIREILNPKLKTSKCIKVPFCSHYKKYNYLYTACCNKIYGCRFCHNENEDHELVRSETKFMQCRSCYTFQKISNSCQNPECYHFNKKHNYFCDKCNLWFNDIDYKLLFIDSLLINNIDFTKKCYHCKDCGICRIGKIDDFKHCHNCNLCIDKRYFDSHPCKVNIKEFDCPICLKSLWDSQDQPHILKCGHNIHKKCFMDYISQNNYKCPTCKMSMFDMSPHWNILDDFLQTQQVPQDSEYYNWKSKIHCNDCLEKSTIKYHFCYNKCPKCNSYNTVVDNILKDTDSN